MELKTILAGGGGLLLVILTLVQIAPIKINPWSRIARAIGNAINHDVIVKVDETRKRLEAHIEKDAERHADSHRARILRFNDEEWRGEKHSREHFLEILAEIDQYNEYCSTHPNYRNSRAVHAIANINRLYDELQADPQKYLGGAT